MMQTGDPRAHDADIRLPRGGFCTLTLGAAAEAARRRPVLAGPTVHSQSGVIRARVHGTHGTTRWVSGAVSDGSDAARAVRPLSARFAPRTHADGRPAAPMCARSTKRPPRARSRGLVRAHRRWSAADEPVVEDVRTRKAPR